jgi:RNA polymerase-binding transcription factor DksA
MLSPQFISEMQQKLEEQKQKLQTDLAGLAPHTEVGNDYDENATELEIDEVNQDLIERMKKDLEKIDKALDKIAAGTYGTDDDGQEIAEERLRAIPWADKAI